MTPPPVAAPPRPRITLRVGATGHRAKALESVDKTALRDSVRLALRKIAEHAREIAGVGEGDYSADPPRLVLVSALAEGADQLIADVGLELGYELDAPLPFVRDEYKKDFADTSGFDRLIRRARSVLELDGDRSTGPLPYARVGRILLGHTDVLLAIWDGEAANGRGGTGEVVVGAVALGIPVIWISSKSPNTCSVISAGAESMGATQSLDVLPREIKRLLDVPDDPEGVMRGAYWQDQGPGRRLLARTVPCVHRTPRALGGRRLRGARRRPIRDGPLPPSPVEAERVRADDLANRYAGRYRDSFVGVYLFGVFAVTCAMFGYISSWATWLELVTILWVLGLIVWERRHHWHKRWLHYRLLAQQLSHGELLWPIGRSLPSFHTPPYHEDADATHDWVNWLFRARLREAALPPVTIDRPYLRAYRDQWLAPRIVSQVAYHTVNADRSERLEHRVHRLTKFLFGATLVVCALHLAYDYRRLAARAPVAVGTGRVAARRGSVGQRVARRRRGAAARARCGIRRHRRTSGIRANASPVERHGRASGAIARRASRTRACPSIPIRSARARRSSPT